MSDSGAVEARLRKQDLRADWLEQLRAWIEDARAAGISEPEAMVLATADADGRPGGRTVLLKGLDERGLVFFSNRGSRKGRELAANPRVAVVFPWYPIRRQVIVDGTVELLDEQASDEYFAGRPYRSRIGALASRQSSVIAGREVLEQARDELKRATRSRGPFPRPSGGAAGASRRRASSSGRAGATAFTIACATAARAAAGSSSDCRRRRVGSRRGCVCARFAMRRAPGGRETATVRSCARIRSAAFFQHTSCSSG